MNDKLTVELLRKEVFIDKVEWSEEGRKAKVRVVNVGPDPLEIEVRIEVADAIAERLFNVGSPKSRVYLVLEAEKENKDEE